MHSVSSRAGFAWLAGDMLLVTVMTVLVKAGGALVLTTRLDR